MLDRATLSNEKIVGLRYDMLIDEDPLGQVKILRLFKVTVLKISTDRLYWS